MKVPVNLENYPALGAMAEEDKKQFLQLLKGVFSTMDLLVSTGAHKDAETYFGISLQDLTEQLLSGIFDHRGMLSYLPNQLNAETISEAYGHTVNPLHAAFSGSNLHDRDFKPISFEEKFGMDKKDFTVKNWLQGLMFFSYYGSLPDIANYLHSHDHSLYDSEKHENIDKIIEIRPALTYQKAIGILPGKLIPGTGFFDCGSLYRTHSGAEAADCPACHVPESLFSLGENEITVCLECKGGYEK